MSPYGLVFPLHENTWGAFRYPSFLCKADVYNLDIPNLSDFVVQKVYPLGYLVESNGDFPDRLLIQRKPKG